MAKQRYSVGKELWDLFWTLTFQKEGAATLAIVEPYFNCLHFSG